MAMVQKETSSVRKGLADRAKPRTAQSTGGGQANYASRFQNPAAGTNRARTVDRSRFQNPGAGAAPRPQAGRPQTAQAAVRPVPSPYQTPGRPGGRFGAWQPRRAQPIRPAPAAPQTAQPFYGGNQPQPPTAVPGQYQTPGRPAAPQTAQPFYPQQAVPGQYQPPGRPQMGPQVAQAAPMPVPGQYQTPGMPMQPGAESPQQEMARLQQRLAQLQQGQQVYNPTPYTGRW